MTSTVEIPPAARRSSRRCGCDIIAPSDMMTAGSCTPRRARPAAGFAHVRIMAYAAQNTSYASMGPFRDALGLEYIARPSDKRTISGLRNRRQGVREVALDLTKGRRHGDGQARMPYLDIIRGSGSARRAAP